MKYIKLLFGVGMVILVIAYLNKGKFSKLRACSMLDDFKKESYAGKIVDKFID